MRGVWMEMRIQKDTINVPRRVPQSTEIDRCCMLFLVNIGMVTGLVPVVGVPLPLISYGGTSLVTLMASFGILMSIHTHRKREPS